MKFEAWVQETGDRFVEVQQDHWNTHHCAMSPEPEPRQVPQPRVQTDPTGLSRVQ